MTEQIAEPASEESSSTSTAVAAPPKPKAELKAHEGGVMAIMPRNIEEASRYASGLIAADIVPDAFREGGKKSNPVNASLVLMGVLKSLEIGVPPQTGLAGLLPLNGRFSVWGDLAAALVQRTGLVKDQRVTWIGPAFDESLPLGEWPPEYGCEVRYWREGQAEPYIGKYTIRDAKRANLWMNSYKKPWIEHPKRMLFNRARAFCLRDGFADGLNGLTIAEEVLDHLPDPVDERAPSKVTALLREDDEQDNREGVK